MTEDQVVAIYGSIKTLAQSMAAREAALDKKTAALDAAIAQLEKMPFALGKQTSQYIGMGVREAIQQDFSLPIAEAVKGPIADLSRETYHAREVMSQVGKESRYQTLGWIALMIIVGIAMGVVGTYYFFQRDIGKIDDRLDSIQQQIAPAAPNQDKPIQGGSTKGRHGHTAPPTITPSLGPGLPAGARLRDAVLPLDVLATLIRIQ